MCTRTLALAIALAGGAVPALAQTRAVVEPGLADPQVDDCGVVIQGTACLLFAADGGGVFLVPGLEAFSIGDRVRVAGAVDPLCFSICPDADACLDGIVRSCETFTGCGTVQFTQGCAVLVDEDGLLWAIEPSKPAPAVALAETAWISGPVTAGFDCFPLTLPSIATEATGACFAGCGTLVQGVECVVFQADAGPVYVLETLGGFQVGDRVEVEGCLDETCATTCGLGDGCLLANSIAPCDPPLGRCCFAGIVPDPLLCEVTTEANCLALPAPASWTEGADCAGDPCNQPVLGRCCFLAIDSATALCEVTSEVLCFANAIPLSWTEGETCDGDPCNDPPLGRCCFLGILPEPAICAVLTEAQCFANTLPLSWIEGETCLGDPCNPGCFTDCALPRDDVIGIADLLALLGGWGGPGSCDVDGDGVIGIADLLAVLGDWGPCFHVQ